MSCCGGNCGCGSGCKCGDGCKGCKMFPDVTLSGEQGSETSFAGLAPQNNCEHRRSEQIDMNGARKNSGCKCGSNCTCNPCNCK